MSKYISSLGYNPNLQFAVKSTKKLSSFLKYLKKSWISHASKTSILQSPDELALFIDGLKGSSMFNAQQAQRLTVGDLVRRLGGVCKILIKYGYGVTLLVLRLLVCSRRFIAYSNSVSVTSTFSTASTPVVSIVPRPALAAEVISRGTQILQTCRVDALHSPFKFLCHFLFSKSTLKSMTLAPSRTKILKKPP